MAYPYRGPQSPRDEPQFSNFSTNPLSPPRNPNRLSAGMMSSSDVRGSLTRRFTTNALPSLSPIGQQRRQAAGESQVVSTILFQQRYGRQPQRIKQNRKVEAGGTGNGYTYGLARIRELLVDSEPSPGIAEALKKGLVRSDFGVRVYHRRGTSCRGVISDGRPTTMDGTENCGGLKKAFLLSCNNDLIVYELTNDGKPSGAYNRVAPVSPCISLAPIPSLSPQKEIIAPSHK